MFKSLVIREMQVKATMRYHFIPVRMTIVKKIHKQQMLEMVWREGTLLHRWWERQLVQPLWRTVWRFLKKLKLELPYDLVVLILGMYPKKDRP